MDDPLPYLAPAPVSEEPRRSLRHRPTRVIVAGLIILGVGLTLVFSPLLLGHKGPMKFVVMFGLIGILWGLSCLIHGAWDWWRGR